MGSKEISEIIETLEGKRRQACESLRARTKSKTFWQLIKEGRFGDAAAHLLKTSRRPDTSVYSDMIWEG